MQSDVEKVPSGKLGDDIWSMFLFLSVRSNPIWKKFLLANWVTIFEYVSVSIRKMQSDVEKVPSGKLGDDIWNLREGYVLQAKKSLGSRNEVQSEDRMTMLGILQKACLIEEGSQILENIDSNKDYILSTK
ncbi:hypothetical protein TNCV_4296911 [Trichonephila clavipes]|nr:hypothetical protein TNCV_4296911 [Trichonephila clavipes]